MIIHDTVQVILNSQNTEYWLKKGYELPKRVDSRGRPRLFQRGNSIIVRVQDLPPQSNVRVSARCEMCEVVRLVAFCRYGKNCWQCNLSGQKGQNHPRYLSRVKTGGSDRAFDLYLRRKFKITADEYFSMLNEQNHCCAICGVAQAKEGRRFCVDHNHKTGQVRGILCQPCNTGLGLLKDDPEILSKAQNYLKGVLHG